MPGVELILDGPHEREPRHRAAHPAAADELPPHGGGRGEHGDRAPLPGNRAAQGPGELRDGRRRRVDPQVEDASAGRPEADVPGLFSPRRDLAEQTVAP